MANKRSIELKVGIFILVCLALMAGLVWKFGKYEPLTRNSYQITVVFSDVGGIVKDAGVLYGGIGVGKVSDITLDQEGLLKVNVKLDIYDSVKIRKDAKFVINQSGLLGDRYIDVIPQGASETFLKPGDTVTGSTSVDLSEAIHSVVDVLHQAAGTIERVDKAIQRIDETVLSHESLQHIDSSLANIDLASSNAVALTLSLRGVVDDNRVKVDNTLTKFSDAADTLNQTSSNANQVVKNIGDLVAANQDDVRAATKKLAESAARLNEILANLEKGQGTVGKLLVDPTLHDEIVQLVHNWRKYGLLYKEGSKADVKKPAHPVPSGGGTVNFGAGSTQPDK